MLWTDETILVSGCAAVNLNASDGAHMNSSNFETFLAVSEVTTGRLRKILLVATDLFFLNKVIVTTTMIGEAFKKDLSNRAQYHSEESTSCSVTCARAISMGAFMGYTNRAHGSALISKARKISY